MKSKLFYKIKKFFPKFEEQIKKFLFFSHKLLQNKYLHYVIYLFFIILLVLYIWSLKDPYLFYRNFHWKYRDFHIYHLALKIKYSLYFLSWILILQILSSKILIEKIKKYFNTINKKYKKIIIVYFVYIIFILLLSFIELKTKILSIMTPLIVYFVYYIHNYIKQTKTIYKYNFLIDSRYFFLIALILLIYTPIFIYFKDQKIAENLSIYAYYFLVIWVIYELITQKFETQKKL